MIEYNVKNSHPAYFSESAGLQISGPERAAAFLSVLALAAAPVGALAAWLVLFDVALALACLAAGALLVVFLLLFLVRRFHAQPLRRYLRSLEDEAKNIGNEVREFQTHLNQLRQRRQLIEGERRDQINTLKPGYREKSADLNALFLGIDLRERAEVRAALEAYQEAFIRSAIADASIRRVRVPGFSARILEKLEEAGILTAVDVTTERLRAIPNLDPFLIQELDLWRQRIERDALAHKPLHLPAARLDPIRARYQEERMAVKASIEGLVYGMQTEVLKIENRIGEKLIQANALEDSLTRRVTDLGHEHLALRERIRPLQSFTFWRYFKSCLGVK